jgi:hypothetical protein
MGGALTAFVGAARSAAAGLADPYFNYTTLLLPGTGTNGATNTHFLDSSSNNFLITRSGNTTQGAFSPFARSVAYSPALHGGSGYFDGAGDVLQLGVGGAQIHPNLRVPSGTPFTLEFYVYPQNNNLLISVGAGALTAYNAEYGIWISNGVAFIGIRYNTTDVTGYNISGPSWNLNTWQHCALVRESNNNTFLYRNGTRGTAVNVPGAIDPFVANLTYASPAGFYLGRNSVNWVNPPPNSFFQGYISNLRYVIGTAVYTGNFTSPTAPLSTSGATSAAAYPSTANVDTSFAAANTSLLLNFTNAGIIDATAKNILETVDGAQISTTINNPFGAATGSMYFDGSGDWLLMPHTADQLLGTVAFTIEMWVYRNASGTYGLVAKGTSTTGWLVSLNSGGQVVFTYGTSTITSSATITLATWTYIAVVREGTGANQTKIYISGTNYGTGTVSTDFTQTNNVYVGADRTAGSAFSGYISNLRITKGVARTITTPTAPYPLL